MTDWAAKVLEGVPTVCTYDNHTPPRETIWRDDALAAIVRMGAGDGLVERLQDAFNACRPMNGSNELDNAAAAISDAIAHIAALTAQVAENRISEPHDPGDFVGDIFYGHPIKTTMGTHRWTGTEWVALPSEAEALAGLLAEARKEAAALRERVARLEGALTAIDALDPEGRIGDCSVNAISGLVLRMGGIARAALTDGGTA
jgi:hypothetical protein